jgi:hypothetical protein
MMKKVLDKVEDLVLFKAKPTPEQQVNYPHPKGCELLVLPS